jgi:membrane dipeptidase
MPHSPRDVSAAGVDRGDLRRWNAGSPGLHRRAFLQAGASLLALGVGAASAQPRVPLADMHSHLGMLSRASLADEMRANGVALVAWALPSDLLWTHAVSTGIAQKSVPAAGEPAAFFAARLDRENASLGNAGLKRVLKRADIDACVAGGANGVVLAAEGSDFLEGHLDGLPAIYEKGLRHLQLVHYIANPIGDRQTAEPQFNGLSAVGKTLVEACNEQGLLIDLAHCAETSVDQALQISKFPMVWSHSWVREVGGQWQDTYGYQQRRLSLARAKAIADRGGVVGVWGFGLERPGVGRNAWSVGRNDAKGYARELADLVNQLGADHVGIGTDLAGVGASASINDYADLRKVVDHLQELKLPESAIERVACGNYARVLKTAMKE